MIENIRTRDIFATSSSWVNERLKRKMLQYMRGDDLLLRDDLNYTIAGGFCNCVDTGRAINDLDIYPQDGETRAKLIATLINNSWDTNNDKTFIKDNRKVQILGIYNNPKDILREFDFTVCMKGWNPNQQTTYSHFMYNQDVRHKIMNYNMDSTNPIKNIIHLTKYINYGYKIRSKDLLSILFKINHLQLSDPEVFKEQLMYYESDGLLNEYMELYTKVTGTEIPPRVSSTSCPTCNGEIGEFRDEISVREHGISGLCQSCQDSVFGR